MADRAPVSYWLVGIYGVLSAVALATAGVGWMRGVPELLAAGALGVVAVGCSAPIAWHLRGLRAEGGGDGGLDRLAERVEAAVREMTEVGALSDDARRVLNRGRERELLRRAIEEDIAAEDWDAAMVLVKELAERFGYRADAEGFRSRIETARFRTVDRRVTEAIEGVDRLITQLRWEEARAEAQRVLRLYPDAPRVDGLRHRVEAARGRFRADLEHRFLHAAEGGDVDAAMGLLREMDLHLTEGEAAPYQELARGVIARARERLGERFKAAVQERAWEQASRIGEQIIEEFPNTRMADEVREMIEEIRGRAAGMRSGS